VAEDLSGEKLSAPDRFPKRSHGDLVQIAKKLAEGFAREAACRHG
jgi:hypothetical protein